MPARKKWWDDVVRSDVAAYYAKAENAAKDTGVDGKGKPKGSPNTGKKGSFIWGDRVRILKVEGDTMRVGGRGGQYWMHKRHLGGEPLLEVYFIDVGQGDGTLIVTPKGEHLLIDGGNLRMYQNGGKNAADFVDWKFYKDYCDASDRDDDELTAIRLDAIIATHNDIDHFGGLFDLLHDDEKNLAELDSSGVRVERMYHAGLSWWFAGRDSRNGKKRSLGVEEAGCYTQLVDDRGSCLPVIEHVDDPDSVYPNRQVLDGAWGSFIRAVSKAKRNSGATTGMARLSNKTDNWLPDFGPNDDVSIRVLGPIESTVDGKPALKVFPDGTSKNTNGHSVVLRLDYGDRRILLTGDLNTHSQNHIMTAYGDDFVAEFQCDVTKGCHHGSHDVSFKFLEGLRPLATVISSGDAEDYDHPRPNIVSASAITGRRIVDFQTDRLVAPLIYMTEVARSVRITKMGAVGVWDAVQPAYPWTRPTGAKQLYNTEAELSQLRAYLGSSQSSPKDWPRMDKLKAVDGLRYGLINVRTDGKRLFFAQMEETGSDWAVTVLSEAQITAAR